MGRTWTVAAFAVAGLTGLASWAASSPQPDRLPPILERPADRDHPAIRLDFSEGNHEPILLQPSGDVPPRSPNDRLVVPAELPGADAPPIVLPKFEPASPKAFEDAIHLMFPPLPHAGVAMPPDLSPDGRPYTLDALEQMAFVSSPVIRQACAAVESAQGIVRQTGLYPNPILGFQNDGIQQNRTQGAIGGFFNVDLVYHAKLRLAKAVAVADRELVRLAMAQIEAEVLAGVRHGYFAVLAAQENMRVQEALTRLTDEAYRQHIERMKAGSAMPHEAVRLRSLAFQSRGQLVVARNRYLSSWKQLAATIGRIEMPPTMLDGRIDRPLPIIDFETLHASVLAKHSEVLAAQKLLEKAQTAVKLAEANRIPDVTVSSAFLRDSTFGLDNGVANVRVGVPVPIFNRNQGNIARARADLVRAQEESNRVRASLTAQLSEAYERYDNQRRLIVYSRDHIVPDQVRAFRSIHERRSPFAEQLLAQQSLVAAIAAHQHSLGEAWSAVVDLGKLAQTRDLASLGTDSCPTRLACLTHLPSCQPASAGLYWPEAMPPETGVGTPQFIPDLRQPPCAPSTCMPRETMLDPGVTSPKIMPNPVSDPVTVAPLSSVEKSTKRLKFFAWPTATRRDLSSPVMLPQTSDPAPCCPDPQPAPAQPTAVPRMLPQIVEPTVPTPPAPTRLSPPASQKEVMLPPIPPAPTMPPPPIIIDGPIPRPAASIVPVAAVSETIAISSPITLPTHAPIATKKAPIPLPIIIEGPSPRPTAPVGREPVREATFLTPPNAPAPPPVDIPSLKLPKR